MLKAALIGNLGNEPEMRYSANGAPFLRFNVASNYRTRTPEGDWQDKTEWVRVTVTGQRAESLSQYLKKGTKVYVDGRLEARPWTDQQGQIRAGLEVMANEVQFMSPREQGEGRGTEGRPVQPLGTGRDTVAAHSQGGFMASEQNQQARRQVEQRVDDSLEDVPF